MWLYKVVLQHVCCVSGRSAIPTTTIQPEIITLRHTNYLVVFSLYWINFNSLWTPPVLFVLDKNKQTNKPKNNTSLSHVLTCTRTPIWSNIPTSCLSHTGEGKGLELSVMGPYVRLRVWKILDIWSMTGPVSGSFIHCVLFRGFSSMSSKAAQKRKGEAAYNKESTKSRWVAGKPPVWEN